MWHTEDIQGQILALALRGKSWKRLQLFPRGGLNPGPTPPKQVGMQGAAGITGAQGPAGVAGVWGKPYTPTPYTLHPSPYTLHPAPYTLKPQTSALNPKP